MTTTATLAGVGTMSGLRQVALGAHRDGGAATEHQRRRREWNAELRDAAHVHAFLSFIDAAGLTEHVDLDRTLRPTDGETDEGAFVIVAHGTH